MIVGFRLEKKVNKKLTKALKVKGTSKNAFFGRLSKIIVDRPDSLDIIYREFFGNEVKK